ncbi:ornithine carbamoyltransferase [Bacillus haikouensis]|uniref:ornithine carbamoyltransferase n=1 Tax=Bacillus haikouensis TaxID=1510468 RepID=UPI0015545DBC|nr:ornithine carbamoyltransferase [Bacillus haikouensis]NQD65914.1 ornithine carbamoyltransferase [Bacillus haikouensis]
MTKSNAVLSPFKKISLKGRDLLTWLDYTTEEVHELLSLAEHLKKNPISKKLEGKTLGMIFEKSSTRTRVSFEAGMLQMGGHAIYLNSRDIQLGRGESIADTAKVLSAYVDAIMIRTFEHEKVAQLAEHASVPVINGLCDTYHPCQALADVLTIYEVKGNLAGLKVVYIGDGNNVAHSFVILCAKLGMDVVISCPKGYEPDQEVIDATVELAQLSGGSFTLSYDPEEAAAGADIVYTDVWASMGQEEETSERLHVFEPYQVNQELLAHASDDVKFLHCLPAHRGEEVTADVIDGGKSAVFQQAENRLHVQKAILLSVLGE